MNYWSIHLVTNLSQIKQTQFLKYAHNPSQNYAFQPSTDYNESGNILVNKSFYIEAPEDTTKSVSEISCSAI